MPDSTVLPGVRPGQVWHERRPRAGRTPRRIEITGLDAHDVSGMVLNAAGERFHTVTRPRATFEQRYELASESGAADV